MGYLDAYVLSISDNVFISRSAFTATLTQTRGRNWEPLIPINTNLRDRRALVERNLFHLAGKSITSPAQRQLDSHSKLNKKVADALSGFLLLICKRKLSTYVYIYVYLCTAKGSSRCRITTAPLQGPIACGPETVRCREESRWS